MKLHQINRLAFSAFFLVGLLVSSLSVQGQTVTEGKRDFMKKETANGFTIVIEGVDKNVQHVLDKQFSAATSSRGRNERGLRSYRNARVSTISNSTMDVFYRVEKAAKTDPPQTRVTLFLSSGNENFMDSKTYPDEVTKATDLLEGLQLDVTKYEFTLSIDAQGKLIEKEIQKHDRLVKDSISLEQKLAETIEEIENNKVSRANQLVRIEEEKQNLITIQQTLAALDQNGLQEMENNSEENMEKQLEGVARKPELNEDKQIEVKDGTKDKNDEEKNR